MYITAELKAYRVLSFFISRSSILFYWYVATEFFRLKKEKKKKSSPHMPGSYFYQVLLVYSWSIIFVGDFFMKVDDYRYYK